MREQPRQRANKWTFFISQTRVMYMNTGERYGDAFLLSLVMIMTGVDWVGTYALFQVRRDCLARRGEGAHTHTTLRSSLAWRDVPVEGRIRAQLRVGLGTTVIEAHAHYSMHPVTCTSVR